MGQVTVPANLLLLGEYAVLEEGGLGVAVAVEPSLVATCTAAPRLEIVGKWANRSNRWPGKESGALFSCAVESLAWTLGSSIAELSRFPLRVAVDSSAFYEPAGGKRGLGSSAATTVAICFSILDRIAASNGEMSPRGGAPAPVDHRGEKLLERTFACALRAHRAFQKGRGSGYDVAASVFGGIGRFRGGIDPQLTPADLPWLPPLVLFRGRAPVATSDAIESYTRWRTSRPKEADRFLLRSNECVEGFLSATGWADAMRWVLAARTLGMELGDTLGVPSRVETPTGCSGIAKSVGAGNELGVLFAATSTSKRSDGYPASCFPLVVADDGVARISGDGSGE